jgi:hypothetical protein
MLLPAYGVLIGTLNHFTREAPTAFGPFSHGKLHVDTPAGQYEGAVDVSTPTGTKVQYRLVRHLNHLALLICYGASVVAAMQPIFAGYLARSTHLNLAEWVTRPTMTKLAENISRLTAAFQ